MARDMRIKIPEPISAKSLLSGYYRGDRYIPCELKFSIENSSKLTFKGISGLEYRIDTQGSIEVNCDSVGGWKLIKDLEEESEVVKMSKFKVGDIVKVKAVEELKKSSIYGCCLNTFANTIHKVSYVYGDRFYELDGCGSLRFDDSMLINCRGLDSIYNINVIVPNKVVEIEFYDGKEKMICHESDTFDLKKCCFIAIAKRLYKKEYTYEGIEYMAKQLMYQKKYVKIVDKALKDYKKKMDELDKRAKKEEEMKIVHARQVEKKRRYKERRTQRYREDMINLIADSINEARARRKAKKWQVF